MDPFFGWLEATALSTWIRETQSILGFQAIVVLHTLGMGLLAGTSAAIDLRILGAARRIPLPAMEGFFPVFWTGLAINVFSGVLLLIAYPTKAMTNPLFYLKLTLIGLAVWAVLAIRARVLRGPLGGEVDQPARAKFLAALSLALWVGAITAGRLLAYTHTRLLVDVKAHF
ncbi:MAG: hypothetical protein ABIO37_05680 [Caulobacteraceae bacterium]